MLLNIVTYDKEATIRVKNTEYGSFNEYPPDEFPVCEYLDPSPEGVTEETGELAGEVALHRVTEGVMWTLQALGRAKASV